MFRLTVTQTLAASASPEAVWRAFESVARWPETMPALVEATLEPEGRLASGSRIRSLSEGGVKRDERVIEAEPPHRLVLAIEDENYRARTEYRIASDDGETEVTVIGSLEARGLGQSLRFLLWRERMTPMLKTTLRERTRAIIELAERMQTDR